MVLFVGTRSCAAFKPVAPSVVCTEQFTRSFRGLAGPDWAPSGLGRRMNRRAREGNCRPKAGRGFPSFSVNGRQYTDGYAGGVGLSPSQKPLSALEIGVDQLSHLIDRQG